MEEFFCNCCNLQLRDKYSYAKHLLRASHIKNDVITEDHLYCKACNYHAKRASNLKTHLSSKKHLAKVDNNTQYKYVCEICNYRSNFKSEYDLHIKTKKHLTNVERVPSYQKEIDYNKNLKRALLLFMTNNTFQNTIVDYCVKENLL